MDYLLLHGVHTLRYVCGFYTQFEFEFPRTSLIGFRIGVAVKVHPDTLCVMCNLSSFGYVLDGVNVKERKKEHIYSLRT